MSALPPPVLGPSLAVDKELALYEGATGRRIGRATGSGIVNVVNGVYQTPIDPITLGSSPVGSVIEFAGSVEPSGWLFCFGQAISRTGIYAPLFGIIGTTWGAGNGTSTFNVPDFRGRVGAGRDDMSGTVTSRLRPISKTGATQGTTATWNYLYSLPDLVGICRGMNVTGPGLPAGTTVTNFQDGTTLEISAVPTAITSGTYKFFFLDGAVLGANGGTPSHLLHVHEMPSHTHYTAQLQGTNGLQAGPHYGWQASATGAAGFDQAHQNLQPSLIVNKIIKFSASATVSPPSPGTGDVTGPDNSIDGEICVFSGTSGKFIRRGSFPTLHFHRGYIAGFRTLVNATDYVNDIDVQDGECRDATNAEDIVLAAPMTKRLDAFWSAGTNQGGLDQTGSLVNGTYHIFVIKRIDTQVVDVLFSPSAVSPILPSGYSYQRRIGSFLRENGVISGYEQDGDYFFKDAPITEDNMCGSQTLGTTQVLTLLRVPRGIRGYLISSILAYTAGSSCYDFYICEQGCADDC